MLVYVTEIASVARTQKLTMATEAMKLRNWPLGLPDIICRES